MAEGMKATSSKNSDVWDNHIKCIKEKLYDAIQAKLWIVQVLASNEVD